MAICENCLRRETGSFTDGSLLENYVCERCRTVKAQCPWCKNKVDVVLRK